MELVKIIITDLQEYIDLISKRFNLKKIKDISFWWDIYEGERTTDDWKEKIILVLTWLSKIDIDNNMNYILENYIPNKIINIWIAWNLDKIDLKSWDIILPNTFIDEKKNEALFLNNAIWSFYDLNTFWLILNWICLSWDKLFLEYEENLDFSIDNWIDIYDNIAFSILSIASKNSLLENCLVIKWITNDLEIDNKNFIIENSVNILELIL